MTTTWQRGDQDPTVGARSLRSPMCHATSDNTLRGCTWPLDHTHPQHIAGGLNGLVLEVWPVTA